MSPSSSPAPSGGGTSDGGTSDGGTSDGGRPRIVMDARFTRMDHHDGISRYGASLMAAVAPYADVTMLIHDERQLALLPKLPWVKVNSPLSPMELFVARHVNRLGADLVFCPMQTMGTWGRTYPLVLTLHDLIYYEHPAPPGFLPAPVRVLWRLYHKAYWPQRLLLNRADTVATISHTTLGLMNKFRLTRKPIRIVGNAPQGGRVPRDPAVAPDKTLAYMGSFMPYKNVETLIAGMARLPDYTLHLLSRITAERRAELESLVPAGAKVVFHNGVTDAEYDQLLLRSTALVTLSKAEGYGLPLVEAMALGTPVVVADTDIFREVGGAAAHYVPSDSPTAFAAAVRALDDHDAWAASSVASVAQAATFSWDDSARELLAMVEELRGRG
ncbi:mannosyltransferase [Bacillus sp. SRB_336]|nr:mannosyltransferase [Bacillus sp. SRB_336]